MEVLKCQNNLGNIEFRSDIICIFTVTRKVYAFSVKDRTIIPLDSIPKQKTISSDSGRSNAA
jgi:hypothetical protein